MSIAGPFRAQHTWTTFKHSCSVLCSSCQRHFCYIWVCVDEGGVGGGGGHDTTVQNWIKTSRRLWKLAALKKLKKHPQKCQLPVRNSFDINNKPVHCFVFQLPLSCFFFLVLVFALSNVFKRREIKRIGYRTNQQKFFCSGYMHLGFQHAMEGYRCFWSLRHWQSGKRVWRITELFILSQSGRGCRWGPADCHSFSWSGELLSAFTGVRADFWKVWEVELWGAFFQSGR